MKLHNSSETGVGEFRECPRFVHQGLGQQVAEQLVRRPGVIARGFRSRASAASSTDLCLIDPPIQGKSVGSAS